MYSKLLIFGVFQQSDMELEYNNGQRKNFKKWIGRLENSSPYIGDAAQGHVLTESNYQKW